MKSNLNLVVFEKLSNETQSQVDMLRKLNADTAKIQRNEIQISERLDKYCSEKDIRKWILVFEKNILIGMTVIFTRIITLNSQQIILGGIGKVLVHSKYRRQGVGSFMLKQAMATLRELNVDIAYLCTNLDSFLPAFYQKFGFIVLNNVYIYKGKSGKQYQDKDGMLAPIKPSEVFDKIISGSVTLNLGIGNW